jgi:hypothetical protein
MFIAAPRSFPEGTVLNLKFRLAVTGVEVRTRCEVRNSGFLRKPLGILSVNSPSVRRLPGKERNHTFVPVSLGAADSPQSFKAR